MTGLAVIIALLAIAVLAPFLASSFPIVMMSSDPVAGDVTGQPIFEPGLSFPLFAPASSAGGWGRWRTAWCGRRAGPLC